MCHGGGSFVWPPAHSGFQLPLNPDKPFQSLSIAPGTDNLGSGFAASCFCGLRAPRQPELLSCGALAPLDGPVEEAAWSAGSATDIYWLTRYQSGAPNHFHAARTFGLRPCLQVLRQPTRPEKHWQLCCFHMTGQSLAPLFA